MQEKIYTYIYKKIVQMHKNNTHTHHHRCMYRSLMKYLSDVTDVGEFEVEAAKLKPETGDRQLCRVLCCAEKLKLVF